jgi:peptide/nickel transport system substrate-binding protein
VKKSVSFLLALLMVAAVVAACAPSEPEVVKETVVVEVEKPVEVVVTEVVETEVEVVVTEVVEKEVVVTQEVEVPKEVVVTPTPRAAARGGMMTAGFDVGPGGFPERFDAWNSTAGYYFTEMYLSKLVHYCDVNLTEICGDLAESWEISEDGLEMTFKLREGVTWHDGEPFTADDVKFTLNMIATPGVSRWNTKLSSVTGHQDLQDGNATELAGVEVVDDLTIKITHDTPNAAFLDGLSFLFIMPRHAMQDLPVEEVANNPWWQTSPVGTGPFKWVKYETGQYVELERFEDYWRGAPLLDRLVNRYFPEPGTAVLALEAGEIDFTYVTADEMFRLRENPAIEIIPGPSWVMLSITLNKSMPTFADPRVRQAFMYAIDRQTIVDTLWQGTAEVVNCNYRLDQYVPDDINPYEYDPDKAKALLDEAGFDYSQEFELLTYYNDQLSMDILAAVQQYMADVGVNITPRPVDVPTFVAEYYTEDPKWTMWYGGSGNGPDPDVHYASYHTEAAWPAGSNAHFYSNPEVDAAFDAGRAEMDPAERNKSYQEVCRLLNEDAASAYMFESVRYGASTGRIGNFTYTPSPGSGRFYNAAETWYVKR